GQRIGRRAVHPERGEAAQRLAVPPGPGEHDDEVGERAGIPRRGGEGGFQQAPSLREVAGPRRGDAARPQRSRIIRQGGFCARKREGGQEGRQEPLAAAGAAVGGRQGASPRICLFPIRASSTAC
ncbi:hypothetical protein, partial [Neoroseomonas alkaliterrae]|uniref:hypothetical protein n=1 Tax=Neoroseomonas alkaliterrae TaxID=1452450 RepID=UPI001BA726C1